AAARAVVQLPVGLLAAAVLAFRRASGHRDDAEAASGCVRSSGWGGGLLSVRQLQGGGAGLGGRRASLQPAFPGLLYPLRLPALGVPTAASADQGEGGTPLPLRGNQLAVRPGLPQPRAPQRGDHLVAAKRRRRPRAWRDETAAGGPTRS